MNSFFNIDQLIVYCLIILIVGFSIATLFMLVKYKILENARKNNLTDRIRTTNHNNFIESNKKIIEEVNIKINHFDGLLIPVVKTDFPDLNIVDLEQENNDLKVKNFTKSNFVQEFYMAKPVDNYFHESAKSSISDGTIYKFEISDNPGFASYEVHTLGAPINEIIKRAETYILPACDEDNLATLQTKSIITVKRGTVKFESNKWIILTKALIKYE